PLGEIADYDFFRPYLHTRTLRFSYGAVKGREHDAWRRALVRPLPEALRQVSLCGFGAIYIDRAGHADRRKAVEQELATLLETTRVVSDNERYSFFSMDRYNRRLREELGEAEWEARSYEALRPITSRFDTGFHHGTRNEKGETCWCEKEGRAFL